jgi:hypothetical protein
MVRTKMKLATGATDQDSDIVKAIARIQHERGWDFGIAPCGATLADLIDLSNRLTDEFPDLSPAQMLRCLRAANDQKHLISV